MQRSSSSRNMPRKRCAGSQRSSGYWTVTFFLNRCRPVIPSPARRSSSMEHATRETPRGSSRTSTAATATSADQQPSWPAPAGSSHFPAQLHQLIEAVAREGAAEPDVDEEEHQDLEDEPDGAAGSTPAPAGPSKPARPLGNGRSHPPRKSIVATAEMTIMLAYSPRKKRAKCMPAYSVWKPATSSDSASGRSNGLRLVSATPQTK